MSRTCMLCPSPYYALERCVMHYSRLRRRRPRPRVDTAPVLAYRRCLRAFGWSDSAVARAVGVRSGHLDIGATMPQVRADAILALPLAYQDSRLAVPFLGTGRRLDALGYAGYPTNVVARLLGLCGSTFRHARHQGRIKSRHALAVADLYARWAGGVDAEGRPRRLPGWPEPSATQAVRARHRGALPAAAWDGLDMDDPATQPWGHVRPAPRRGRLPIDVDEARHLLAGGLTLEEAAPKVGAADADALRDALQRDERKRRGSSAA